MKTKEHILKYLEELVNIPSPSGFTKEAIRYVQNVAADLGYPCELINKGGAVITVQGKTDKTLGLSAHVDTLGAMVRSIKGDGKIRFSLVGGFTMESIEGSYCKIHTRTGKVYEGTILSTSPSVHVYEDARSLSRTEENMEIRIDELVYSKEDTENLGICTGDFISFAPEFRAFENGYIKTRHLDDKAAVAILLAFLRDLKENQIVPAQTLKLVISNYEEIGHGASYIPEDIEEFIAIDMGALGKDLNGSEQKVSICVKDSSGPYDYDMTSKLIQLAKNSGLNYALDIYPHYGSDVSAALRGGKNIRGALIGPGVHASHGMERTHMDALLGTFTLIKHYIL